MGNFGESIIPIYSYICDFCGTNFETFKTKYNPSKRRKCPVCKKQAKLVVANLANVEKDNPRWSWSMGVNVSQLAEARRIYSSSTYNDKGQLLIKNRHHKLQEMRKRNMGLVELE